MEFFVVPLFAIALATFGIYKLAALVFHVRLTFRLLGLLVVFAWLISMVLPGIFFQSAGFMGSVGISLASAVGFAWLATVYDAKTHASQVIDATGTDGVSGAGAEGWTPPAETSFPLVPVEEAQPVPCEEAVPEKTPFEVYLSEAEILAEMPAQTETEPAAVKTVEAVETVEVEQAPLSLIDPPASDSLEDLLDHAFAHRTRGDVAGALESFRLIRERYGESEALPMVVAEIVSTLQSQGNYEAAIAEVAAALTAPAIRRQPPVAGIFMQKMAYLQALRELLIEQGKPSLPFEQIPAEWSDLLEQRLAVKHSQL